MSTGELVQFALRIAMRRLGSNELIITREEFDATPDEWNLEITQAPETLTVKLVEVTTAH